MARLLSGVSAGHPKPTCVVRKPTETKRAEPNWTKSKPCASQSTRVDAKNPLELPVTPIQIQKIHLRYLCRKPSTSLPSTKIGLVKGEEPSRQTPSNRPPPVSWRRRVRLVHRRGKSVRFHRRSRSAFQDALKNCPLGGDSARPTRARDSTSAGCGECKGGS